MKLNKSQGFFAVGKPMQSVLCQSHSGCSDVLPVAIDCFQGDCQHVPESWARAGLSGKVWLC